MGLRRNHKPVLTPINIGTSKTGLFFNQFLFRYILPAAKEYSVAKHQLTILPEIAEQ
jgi:hypothetical protein